MKLSEFFETHGWCRGASARDVNNLPVVSTSPDAVAWCVAGAASKLGLSGHLQATEVNWISFNDQFDTTRAKLIEKLKEHEL